MDKKLFNPTKLIASVKNRKEGLQFLIYNICGNSFTLSINLLLPFILDVDTYGFFALLFAIHNVLIAFFTFGLEQTILKFSTDESQKDNILINSFWIWFILSIIGLPIFSLILWFFIESGFLKISFTNVFYVIISAMLVSYHRVLLSYYVAKSMIKKYGRLFVFNKITQFLVILLASLLYGDDLTAIAYAFALHGIFDIVYIMFVNGLKARRFSSKRDVLVIAKFTLPLSLNTVGNLGYNYGFNLFVSPLLTSVQLGVLNIFTQLGTIYRMILTALNNGYLPKFYEGFKISYKESVKKYFVYIFQNSIALILPVFVLGLVYKYYAYKDSPDYGIYALFIFFIGLFFYNFKAVGTNYLVAENKTAQVSLLTIWTSVLNITVGVFLTKHYGFIGCVYGLTIGFVIQTLVFNGSFLNRFVKEKK